MSVRCKMSYNIMVCGLFCILAFLKDFFAHKVKLGYKGKFKLEYQRLYGLNNTLYSYFIMHE